MFIQTQDTPNPQTLKFIPGVQVLSSGTRSYGLEDNRNDAPIVDSIFKIKGIKSVFLAKDFISVTKDEEQDWEYLKPLVLAGIMDHFVSGMPAVLESSEKRESSNAISDDELTKQIVELIETRVRPAVAQDGGDIVFRDFKEGVVYLEMQGACSGCPSSTITLKNGIENMLKHYIPEVTSVESV
jgi:NFU1 iron-sulfur cluster scaffold homolog, mitochondrial